MFDLDEKELETLKSLDTPGKIQDFFEQAGN